MEAKTKCIFLDRDGVLNVDNPNYTFRVADFKIIPGVIEALAALKKSGFLLIVVTNQSGIAKGIYTKTEVNECHLYFQKECRNLIDHFYFSPYHRTVTESLATKPGTLMFEKAIAKFNIDIRASWMIGDRGRDIVPARQLGIRTIQIGDEVEEENRADYQVESLRDTLKIIIS